jgi:uncharacterized phage infection (PIP) family protein YhgE
MEVMSRDYEQSKEMIRRYDEVLLEKANKLAVKELYEYCQSTFTKQKPYAESTDLLNSNISKLFEETKKLQDALDLLS